MRRITLAGLVAVVAVLLIAPAAYAAPSMTVSDVASPTGSEWDNPDARTTWNVALSGISAWDSSTCWSTANFTNGESLEGEDGESADWRLWPFGVDTSFNDDEWNYNRDYVPLSSVTARCVLEKKTYLGRRSYRSPIYREKTAASTYRRSGCTTYSYSTGKLTIDCRRSSTAGSASWRFPLRRSDWYREGTIYFDRSQSTLGPHNLSSVRNARSVVLTETVSPGTMITVTEVDAKISRRYWRAAYLKQKKTLYASWYA